MTKLGVERVLEAIERVRRRAKMDMETSKIRARALPWCKGEGADLGCARDKIRPEAVGVDRHPFPEADKVDDVRRPDLFEPGSLDYVYSSHCLEHLDDVRGVLATWISWIKPGGVLVLYVPHPALYTEPNAEHMYPGWTPEELAELLTEQHCTVEESLVHDDPGCYSTFVVARKTGHGGAG